MQDWDAISFPVISSSPPLFSLTFLNPHLHLTPSHPHHRAGGGGAVRAAGVCEGSRGNPGPGVPVQEGSGAGAGLRGCCARWTCRECLAVELQPAGWRPQAAMSLAGAGRRTTGPAGDFCRGSGAYWPLRALACCGPAAALRCVGGTFAPASAGLSFLFGSSCSSSCCPLRRAGGAVGGRAHALRDVYYISRRCQAF